MQSYRNMSDAEKEAYTNQSIKDREELSKCETESERFMFFCDKYVEYRKKNPIEK